MYICSIALIKFHKAQERNINEGANTFACLFAGNAFDNQKETVNYMYVYHIT